MSDDEERELSPVERALVRLRLAAYAAMTTGATRSDIEREVAIATRIAQRQDRERP